MPVQFQTSFIPKKTPVMAAPTQRFGGRSINVFGVISLIVFFLIAGLAAGVLFYKSSLVSTIRDMDVALAAAKKSFDPEFVAKASLLNARIEGAQVLLNQHRAISPLLDILEKKTLESVRFQNFTWSGVDEKKITLTMIGQARSFNAVALQSDVFGTEPSFKDPIFSNFNLNESGDVIFNFATTIDPALLRYRETILGGGESGEAGDEEDAGFEE